MTLCKRLVSSCVFFLISIQHIIHGNPMPSLGEMSIEEKVGQLLMTHFNGEIFNDDAQQLIQKAHIGGIIYYNWANGLHSPQQVQKLSNDLQKHARAQHLSIPLLIAIDQEGGLVNRLVSGFTIFPGNYALGQSNEPEFAFSSALATGSEMRAVGINMNLAPVVDVNSNPLKFALGMRCFDSSPEIVTHLGSLTLKGYCKAKIIATLKHFPGYGEAAVDPHLELPVINKSKKELDGVELLPFKNLASSADAIMSAHVLVPALDFENCATLSPAIIEGLLRKQWGYKGIILSDSLVMQGLLSSCGNIEEAAVRALEAGHDILILGGKLLNQQQTNELSVADILRIHQHIVMAIHSGRISQTRLNESVQRILNIKEKYGLFEAIYPGQEEIAQQVNTQEQQELARAIAQASVKIIQGDRKELPIEIHNKKVAVIAPASIKESILKSTLQNYSCRYCFLHNPTIPTIEEEKQAQEMTEYADLIIAFTLNAWRSPKQHQLIRSIQKSGQILLVIAIGDPRDTGLFPEAQATTASFSPTSVSLQAALDLNVRP